MQANTLKKLAIAGMFTVFAAICGILEGMLPLHFFIPIPGVKLGIANIFIVFAYKYLGCKYALAVTIARALTVFLFTGNSFAFFISLSGAVMSFAALVLMIHLHNKVFSFIGISAVCAVFHGLGQLCISYITVGKAVLYYLPVMLIACALTGVFTGALMNTSDKMVFAIFSKG